MSPNATTAFKQFVFANSLVAPGCSSTLKLKSTANAASILAVGRSLLHS